MQTVRLWLVLVVILVLCPGVLRAQGAGLDSGEITVQLIQGLDSALNPRGVSQGKVTRSTNPGVPVGSLALMGIGPDAAGGGFTVNLLRLGINGQVVSAASADVETAPDFFNKTQERLRPKNQPVDAAKGARVYLPERMIVRFTLAPVAAGATGRVATRATAPPPPPVPALPRHPAPTVVDLPAALPGAPPLHASRAANDGCWWEPFGAASLGFELPVQRCSKPEEDASFEATATGLAYHQGGQAVTAFTIFTKPATQTVQAAIKAQFLKTALDRTACVVTPYQPLGAFQSYGLEAPHSRRATCGGLYTNDSDATEGTTFFYDPTQSTTRYLKFTGEFIGVYPFDVQAMRLLQPAVTP